MRLASLLAHVLASTTLVSTTLVACGGQTVGVSEQPAPGADGGNGTDSGPPVLLPFPPPKPVDGGTIDASTTDAGCAPVLVRSGNNCSDVWQQPCGVPVGVNPADGMSLEECNQICGARAGGGGTTYWGCGAYVLADLPGPSFECYTCVEGRRPHGYLDAAMEPTVAGWLARAADLERVSIDAFQILRRELAHHGAPAHLLDRAACAEADEVRHARVLATLARREGARLANAPVEHGPVRALVDIALENAVEGCVRETYGALVAGFQAQHAGRVDVRRVMEHVVRDETTHAELAWDVHEWIMARLSSGERARVTSAMARAVGELGAGARLPTAIALVEALGLPPPLEARRLVAGLDARLWAPALTAIAA
jgi:hypothetical protein